MNLEGFKNIWKDTPDWHSAMKEYFEEHTDADPDLKALRDWVEQNMWGFGERAFYHMWKLIVDEMPQEFKFLEIGVFRGQILALVRMLAKKQNKIAEILGVSPMDGKGGYWESNYEMDVQKIFETFKLGSGSIYRGDSTDEKIVRQVREKHSPFDILYIDGGHEPEVVIQDMNNYLPMLRVGGYLVMDDCADRFDLPDGYFRGHKQVSEVVDSILPPGTENKEYEHLFNIVHNRVWKKL